MRIAIVTGGASGIGRAIGEALVQRGDHAVLADIDVDGAAEVAGTLSRLGPGSASAAELDVRDAEAVADLYRKTHADNGRLDLVFNNAGVAVGGEVEELTAAHWDRVIDVNVKGVAYGVAAAYPIMVRQGFGHIVNTASVAGLVPVPLLTPYATSKHAVVGLSLSLRAEARAFGVRVTAVCPSFVDTPMIHNPSGPADLPQTPLQERMEQLQDERPMRAYPPHRLARAVLRGVDRNRALIVVPLQAQVLWRLTRLSPGGFAAVAGVGARFARRRMLQG